MNTDTLINFFKEIRSVILSIIAVGGALIWLGGLYFLTIEAADERELKQMRRQLAGLQVRKGFADTTKDKQLYKALIDMQENQIKLFKGE